MTKKSWLSSHPHIKNFAYAAVTLAVIITLVFTFGRDTVKNWVESAARSQGYELVPTTEPEGDTQ